MLIRRRGGIALVTNPLIVFLVPCVDMKLKGVIISGEGPGHLQNADVPLCKVANLQILRELWDELVTCPGVHPKRKKWSRKKGLLLNFIMHISMLFHNTVKC